MKLIPASSATWMMRIDSSWSGLPQDPNIIAPRQNLLTDTPVRPSWRCSIRLLLVERRRNRAGRGLMPIYGRRGTDDRDARRLKSGGREGFRVRPTPAYY